MVRTPNFKNWFGDWEKAGIRERLEAQTPIPINMTHVGDVETITKNQASKLLPESVIVKKIIGDVIISRNGVRESIHHSRTVAKLDVIPKLKEVAEQSEYIGAMNDFGNKKITNHYFATRILHDGHEKIVFLRVREKNDSKSFYVHDVFVEEDIKKASSLQTSPLSQEDFAKIRGTGLYKSILQDIYATDNKFVSKVVDSNGEPMVVYHATEAGTRVEKTRGVRPPEYWKKAQELISQYSEKLKALETGRDWSELQKDEKYLSESAALIKWRDEERDKIGREYPETEVKEVIERDPILEFDKKRLGQNTEGNAGSLGMTGTAYTGFWFNAGGDLSNAGRNVMPLFLKIVNPHDAETLVDLAGEIESTGERTAKSAAKAYLKTLPRKTDGLVLEDTEFGGTSFVAFKPNQIKSAIGNNGDFSDSRNILFQQPVRNLMAVHNLSEEVADNRAYDNTLAEYLAEVDEDKKQEQLGRLSELVIKRAKERGFTDAIPEGCGRCKTICRSKRVYRPCLLFYGCSVWQSRNRSV